jgi:WD40 repeat protein/DNA-binding SARP family transcriptional activator
MFGQAVHGCSFWFSSAGLSRDRSWLLREGRAGISAGLTVRAAGINSLSALLTGIRRPSTLDGMGIAVLGPLVVDDDAGPLSPRDRVVLEALVVCAPRAISAEQLADALWREGVPASWRKVVPGCVNRLRRRLGPEAIETVEHGYRLAMGAEEIDIRRFERLVERGHQLLALGEPERAAYALREGLALWRGPPLADLEDWAPGRVESARLKELQLEAEEAVLDASLRMGLHAEVVAEAQARTSEAPLRERRWGLLALGHYLCGSQAEALACLRRARRLLTDELGLDPSRDLVALEQAILRQDSSLTPATALPAPSPTCPYPGLLPYGVDDAEVFFGREADVEACLKRLEERGVLVVVGPSGCGKSSLLRAGLVATLQRDDRRVTLLAPGEDPALGSEGFPELHHGVTLVVDQLEELAAACGDAEEKAALLNSLVRAAERGPVVVAVRADRFGDLAGHPGFARLAEQGLIVINPLGEDALRSAVEGPARSASLLLEPGLVELVVGDVRDEPGGLPLLSHALRQTWERRDGRTLTVQAYRATGGIRGAVARSAEQVFESLPPERRSTLRDLLLRLVSLEADGEPLRARVPRASLPDVESQDLLIEELLRARLLTADADMLALAHEALARAWPRLRGWLEEDQDGQRILRHLAVAASTWEAMRRPESELYRGERLARALRWQEDRRPDLSRAEAEFLDCSRALASAEAGRARSEARGRRRSRVRVSALLCVVVVLVVSALVLADRAAHEADRAEAASHEGSARRAMTLSAQAAEIDRSLLLAVEAVRRVDSSETRAALVTALSRSPALIRSTRINGSPAAVAVSPDGRMVATGDARDGATVRKASSLADAVTIPAGSGAPLIAFTPDSERVVVGFSAGSTAIVDPSTGDGTPLGLERSLLGFRAAADLAISADGQSVASLLADRGAGRAVVAVWDVDSPERPAFTRPVGSAWAIAFDPTGDRLYVATSGGRLTAYDVDTGQPLPGLTRSSPALADPDSQPRPSDGLELSPDGRLFAVANGRYISLLESDTLAEVGRFDEHTGRVQSLEFSPDGALLASGSDDRVVAVWRVADRSLFTYLPGHLGPVEGLAFSPDQQTLYSASSDGTLLQWDLGGGRRFLPLVAKVRHSGADPAVGVLAPDGRAVAYFSPTPRGTEGSGVVELLDLSSGTPSNAVQPLREQPSPVRTTYSNWGSFDPRDGDVLVTAGGRQVRLWEWRTGRLLLQRTVARSPIEAVAYTPDGRRIVVAAGSGVVSVVDAGSLDSLGSSVRLGRAIRDIVIAPDGRVAIALLQDGTYGKVDLDERSGWTSEVWADADHAAISPNDRLLALAGSNGQVGLLDYENGRWVTTPRTAHHARGLRVSYAPDGSIFATSDTEGEVGLWDGRFGSLVALTRIGSFGSPSTVQFLDDSHTLVIATAAGEVYHWDTRVEQWIDFACQVAGRNLNPEEWALAFGSDTYEPTCPEQPSP